MSDVTKSSREMLLDEEFTTSVRNSFTAQEIELMKQYGSWCPSEEEGPESNQPMADNVIYLGSFKRRK